MEKEVVEYSSNKIDILLTKNPINHALLLQNIMNKNSNCNYKNGAVSSFLGITRQDSTVAKLEYSCHLQMAEKQIIEIIEQGVFKEYPSVTHVSIAHKIGESTLGEASLFIATTSPHRHDSIFAIDLLIRMFKENVPIWKKEWYDDGSFTWKENKKCCVGK